MRRTRRWPSSRRPNACFDGWGRRAISPRPGRPRATRTQCLVTPKRQPRCTGVRPRPCRTSTSEKGGTFVKKRINLSTVVFFLLSVAYFVAAAKTGDGGRGNGFFRGGEEGRFRAWPRVRPGPARISAIGERAVFCTLRAE